MDCNNCTSYTSSYTSYTNNYTCNHDSSCAICLDSILPAEEKIACHPVHVSCVKKHFKPECPVCRRVLDIAVTGDRPQSNLTWSISHPLEEEPIPVEETRERPGSAFFPCPMQIMKTYGLLPSGDVEVSEDDLDENYGDISEDEENPRGDEWDYGSTPRSVEEGVEYTQEY